jgi:hypothetical protein
MTGVGLVAGDATTLAGARPGWIALAYLVVMGSLLGYTVPVRLANAPLSLVRLRTSTRRSRCSSLADPVEPVTASCWGGLLVVVGVALVVGGGVPRSRPAVAPDDRCRPAGTR